MPNASSAAATPSAMIENLSGSTDANSWCSSIQCQGRVTAGLAAPPISGCPPREKITSTASANAAARAAGRRQLTAAARTRTTISGQPRYARYSVAPPWYLAAVAAVPAVCSSR